MPLSFTPFMEIWLEKERLYYAKVGAANLVYLGMSPWPSDITIAQIGEGPETVSSQGSRK